MDHEGLAAALRHNSELAVRASELEHKPHVFKIEGIERSRYVAFKGEITEKEMDSPKRQHKAHDLDSFVELVRRYSVHESYSPEVWHGEDQVKCLLDPVWRDQSVLCELETTDACAAIKTLNQTTWDQLALITLLKNELSATGLDDALLLALRAVNFVQHEESAGVVAERSHSFGNQLERKVQGIPDDFPEQLLARFAWWNVGAQVLSPKAPRALESDPSELPPSAELDFIVQVRVQLEIDFKKKGFKLRPLEDDLVRAHQHVQRVLHGWLLDQLSEEKIPVFHGKP